MISGDFFILLAMHSNGVGVDNAIQCNNSQLYFVDELQGKSPAAHLMVSTRTIFGRHFQEAVAVKMYSQTLAESSGFFNVL